MTGELKRTYRSWGAYPPARHKRVAQMTWASDALPALHDDERALPFGLGRSYGDSCLNDDGVLFSTEGMRRFLAFDVEKGVLRCEAGVSLAEILDLVVPRGWFPPVTPGTKFVTLAGAIANDVHGKNHHAAGTLGRHVRRFELVRSDGERLTCSPVENHELFRATIAGMGLTGLMTWVEIQLLKVNNGYFRVETKKMRGLEDFFAYTDEASEKFDYTVCWVDSTSRGKDFGRGLYMMGNHAEPIEGLRAKKSAGLFGLPFKPTVPFTFPNGVLNRYTIGAFNSVFFHKELKGHSAALQHFEPFFYPLDAVSHWNRIYGSRGFLQHQCVIPFDGDVAPTRALLERVTRSTTGSFLTVLKKFGDKRSPGMMSFPRPGITFNFDFPFRGEETLRLCDDLDAIVKEMGGALYPAKDARMSPEMFRLSFPEWEAFAQHVDPRFSSTFWRRVTEERAHGRAPATGATAHQATIADGRAA